eukprot:16450965-Heterocapsa_arctica.AAC.1
METGCMESACHTRYDAMSCAHTFGRPGYYCTTHLVNLCGYPEKAAKTSVQTCARKHECYVQRAGRNLFATMDP